MTNIRYKLGSMLALGSDSWFVMLGKRITLAATACLALASCGQLEMDDVSYIPEYSSVIGAKFRARNDLWAIGITSDANYIKRVDYVVLVPSPGFSGPEVVTKERISKGFVFRVVSILKASSFASMKVVYVVEEVNTGKFKGTPIQVTLTGLISDQNLGLDESIYERADQ